MAEFLDVGLRVEVEIDCRKRRAEPVDLLALTHGGLAAKLADPLAGLERVEPAFFVPLHGFRQLFDQAAGADFDVGLLGVDVARAHEVGEQLADDRAVVCRIAAPDVVGPDAEPAQIFHEGFDGVFALLHGCPRVIRSQGQHQLESQIARDEIAHQDGGSQAQRGVRDRSDRESDEAFPHNTTFCSYCFHLKVEKGRANPVAELPPGFLVF